MNVIEKLDQLEKAIWGSAYNCECQVGGVDALSLDTDWLLAMVRGIKRDYSVQHKAAFAMGWDAAMKEKEKEA